MGLIVHNVDVPDSGLGDALRTGFVNQNTMNAELYNSVVFKVSGYDLSKNDFTDVLLAKLNAIDETAEPNVKADWNELDPTSDAYILNKPVFDTGQILVSAIWTGTGLVFDVTADAFPISGQTYPANPDTVTLEASDATLDRVDLIVAVKPTSPATVGTVGKITGTPASSELVIPPDYDRSIYYVIKEVRVNAAATTPADTVNTVIFDEGTEWTVNLFGTGVINTSDPSTGVNCIEFFSGNSTDYVVFEDSAPMSTSLLDLLQFDIKLKQASVGKFLNVRLRLNGVNVAQVSFNNGANGFDDSNLSYQTISIDKSIFNAPVTDFDEILIFLYDTGTTGYYLDNVKMFTGSGSETIPEAGISDAPNDGKLYGRQNLSWAEIVSTLTEQQRSVLFAGTSSGLLSGGLVTINADPAKIDIAAGVGVLVDRYTDPENPVLTVVSWAAKIAVPVTYLATNTSSHVFIDINGDVVQQPTKGSGQDRREYIILDQLGHSNNTSVSTVINTPQLFASPIDLTRDILSYLGVLSSGNEITANGANLSINKAEGTLMSEGINNDLNPFNPNIKTYPSQIPISIRRRTQTGAGTTSNFLDVGNYDVSGSITSVAANKYTNQRVFLLTSGNVVVQYGQNVYNSIGEAESVINSESFVLLGNLAENAKLICVISVKSNATALNDLSQARFTTVGGIGSSGGGEPSSVLSFNTRTGDITLTNNDVEDVITAATADTLTDTSILPFVKSAILRKITWANFKTALTSVFLSKSVYDPTNITSDAFAMDNMAKPTTDEASIIDADSLSFWDSVALSFKNISWSNFKNLLSGHFLRSDESDSMNGNLQILSGSEGIPVAGENTNSNLILSAISSFYGLNFTTDGTGFNYMQSQRFDDVGTLYALGLQPLGGNVLLGTTTDTGEKIQVNGTGKFTGNVEAPTFNGIKKYVAVITQSGTSNPVATVLENSLGGTVVWTRTGVGTYRATLSGAFTNNKVQIISSNGTTGNDSFTGARINASECDFSNWHISTGVRIDGLAANSAFVEIRVYP